MTVQELLKSRANGLHFLMTLSRTDPYATYPGRTPARRADILRHLQVLDAQTTDTLDTLATSLRAAAFPSTLSPHDLYMLRQRMHCAIDFLARLAESLPDPDWLHTRSMDLALEDQWLLLGVWKEFGLSWLQNLAWRISKAIPENNLTEA